MTDALEHRGPDDTGIQCLSLADGVNICLGHRRLSILDLTSAGHQPMTDGLTGSWMVFNGEIYNHLELRSELPTERFRSTSDTETLLRGWIAKGPDWIYSLRGMFAFAVYDAVREEIWLARDHVGVKPLYIARPEKELWLFASEIRALLASGMVERKISSEGLASYLAFGAVQAPRTMIDNVESLLPGHRCRFSLRTGAGNLVPEQSCYWNVGEHFARSAERMRQAKRGFVDEADWEPLRQAWDDAVRSQMLSDVPVGVFLSGGTDSSCIVATLKRLGYSPRTFSIGFGEHGFDESQLSRLVSERYQTQHESIIVSPKELLGQFNTALGSYDQPSIDGINTYTISRAVREAGIKVAISGLGGDEVFAGYPSFRRLPVVERALRTLPELLLKVVSATLSWSHVPGKLKRLAALLQAGSSRLDIYCIFRELYSAKHQGELLGPRVPSNGLEKRLAEETTRQLIGMDAVNAVSLLEMSLYMQNTLLRDTDQMSMSHALEVRVPLLDHILIERAAKIPGLSKLPLVRQPNKWILVRLAGSTLPREVVQRPKMGFVFPWESWLRGELRAQVDGVLMDRTAAERTGLNAAAVRAQWRQFLDRQSAVRPTEVLALLHLVDWAARNKLNPPQTDDHSAPVKREGESPQTLAYELQ